MPEASDVDDQKAGAGAPLIVALHFLGGRAATWEPLKDALSGRFRWLAVDLPGFGGAAETSGFGVADMVGAVTGAVRAAAPRRWVLIGHSMGAKVACALARAAEDGAPGLGGLERMILLAGSPPSPEPMQEDKRAAMLAWFTGDASRSRGEANGYITDNVGAPLPPDLYARAVADVLRAARAAWIAWLANGSREDWAARVGVLNTPALLVAGEKDDALGAKAQASLMAPHFARARLHTLGEAGHLLPLEGPKTLARVIATFLDDAGASEPTIDDAGASEPTIDAGYLRLIGSDRVSDRTRAVLLKRAEPVAPRPEGVSGIAMGTLRAVADRVIPQEGATRIDLAARIVDALSTGPGDGWRFAALPPDATALGRGLSTLDAAARLEGGCDFSKLDANRQDALLARIADGDLPAPNDAAQHGLSPRQMTLWFEDVRSAATQVYVAHPTTLVRLGFSGIANRGDGTGPQGFVRIGIGEREPWEPFATGGSDR